MINGKKLACAVMLALATPVMVPFAPMATVEAAIDIAAAKAIALEHAGYGEGDVMITKMKPDYDDGRSIFEIEFMVDGKEYDYDVLSSSGAIVSYSCDIKNLAALGGEGRVSMEEAKAIALEHAGLDSAQFAKMKMDYEDGVEVYELKFMANGAQYKYEVCTNGKIKKYKMETWG